MILARRAYLKAIFSRPYTERVGLLGVMDSGDCRTEMDLVGTVCQEEARAGG